MKRWELWYVNFPYEEDATKFSDRPAIILNTEPLRILSVKVTKHEKRSYDKFDTEIVDWGQAGLVCPSVARVSKTIKILKENFRRKIGELSTRDRDAISDAFIRFIMESNNANLYSATINSILVPDSDDLNIKCISSHNNDSTSDTNSFKNNKGTEDSSTSETTYFDSNNSDDSNP